MELVANVWPVVDPDNGVVLRYFMRAYAMDGPDSVISATLRALAPTDFRMARMFAIPQECTLVSEHGEIHGAVVARDFAQHQFIIMERAFAELEQEAAEIQGIASDGPSGALRNVSVKPKFPHEPYIVTTTLWEQPNGELVPQGR